MEADFVGTWITSERFAESVHSIKRLPGPIAFQMAVFLAYERGKAAGIGRIAATVGAISFILPMMMVLTLIGMTRTIWKEWGWTQLALIGIHAAGVGIVISTVSPLSQSIRTGDEYLRIAKWLFMFFGFVIALLKPSLEPLAIIICGLLALAPRRTRLNTAALAAVPTALVGVSVSDIHQTLFFTTLKASALTFGSGFAIIPLLGGEFVDRLQWINHTELLEAISFCLLTPASILMMASYLGVQIAGITGALVATLGVFLIPFINITTWFPTHGHRFTSFPQWRRFVFGAVATIIGTLGASIIKLLEPFVLNGLEIEKLRLDRPITTILIWIAVVPCAYYLTAKKEQPRWAVLLASGLISYAALRWF